MKRIVWLTAISLLALLFSISACSTDDDSDDNGNEPAVTNELTYQGTTYSLKQGFIADFGVNAGTGSYDFDVIIISEGQTYNAATQDFDGRGAFIDIDLNSSNMNDLASGTYTFSSQRDPLTFVDATWAPDFDYSTSTGEEIDGIGGTVKVSRDGNAYVLEFTINLDNGETVTGTFRGVLQEI